MNQISNVFKVTFTLSVVVAFPAWSMAGSIGSGTLSGIFLDDVLTLEPPVIVNYGDWIYETLPVQPVSQGHGTSSYQWATREVNRFFLDGVEMTEDQIYATDLTFEEIDARAEVELGISENSFTFAANDFSNQQKGETFVAGLLEYNNGVSDIGSEVPSVTLRLNTVSADPDFTQTLDIPINIFSTQNIDGNPEASADFIFFADRPELGSFRVFEDESTSVEILAEFNSLDLIGFGGVANPAVGFLSASVSAVPEPSGMIVLLGAFCAAGAGRLRRRFGGQTER